MPFVPNFLLRDLVGWLAALAVLAALAAFFPAELGKKADPFLPAPAGIRPEWYFMFMFQTLKYLPGHILGIEGEIVGIVGFGLGGLFLLLIPFLDRRTARGEPSRLFTWIGDRHHRVHAAVHVPRLHGERDKVMLRVAIGQKEGHTMSYTTVRDVCALTLAFATRARLAASPGRRAGEAAGRHDLRQAARTAPAR